MGSLTIHNLDDSLLQCLHDRARRSGRTVEEEVEVVLAGVIQPGQPDRAALFARMDTFRESLTGRIGIPSEDLLREMRDDR